jgi:hypothetical protein
MATLISKATGNFTTAATWAVADTTSLANSEVSSSAPTTIYTSSPTFVPGAITIDALAVKINTVGATPAGIFSAMLGKSGNISSVSIGSPTTITTSTPHGLVTGEAIVIAGTSTLATTIGSWTVTVTGASTFTIPVAVVSVTTGTGTWATVKATIQANSSAAATVITTTASHGLTTGTNITIKGSTASPSLNGSYAVTVLTANTFSIPVNTTGGGFSTGVGVYNINGVTDTLTVINATDLPTVGMFGWVTLKLAAPVTLVASITYDFRVAISSVGSCTVYRSATAADWSRMLRTTTTQAPATGDNLNITGEYTGPGTSTSYTVTMDNTAATVFGRVEASGKGTLACGIAASTNYKLTTGSANGSIFANGDGIITLGTSGSPIPSTSTMTLQLNQNAVAITNGIFLRGNGSFTSFGASKTMRALLNADAAAAATSLTSDISTGWVTGDVIAVASTTRTAGETETVTLSGNASGTTIPVSALTNAHSGSAPTKAELGNLTRNVKITGESITLTSFMFLNTDAVLSLNYTELNFMGSGTGSRRGIDILTTNGSMLIDNCVFRNWENGPSFGLLINQAGNANITCTNTIFYRVISNAFSVATTTTASTIIFDNILGFTSPMSNVNGQAMTFTNITAVGNGIVFGQSAVLAGLTIDNITAHSCTGAGLSWTTLNQDLMTCTNLTSWRNTTRGLFLSSAKNIYFNNVTAFGNASFGMDFTQSAKLEFNNVTLNAGVTLTQPTGISIANNIGIYFTNSTFGATTTHATADVNVPGGGSFTDIVFRNCSFASTNEVAGQSIMSPNSIIGSSKHDQVNGTHKLWRKYGTITADSVINFTPSVSLRAAPSSATYKLTTVPREFAIPSGKTARVSVALRRSVAGDGTAYNGNLPRLIMKTNNSAGISTETVLATASGTSLGAWETISGTTTISTDATVHSVYIDCDGTTGWINEDNWKIQIINGAALGTNVNSEDFWQDGKSVAGINTLLLNNSGSETYWVDGQPAKTLFPSSAVETGKFFSLF